MIVRLGYLFPYYYLAPDKNKFNGMTEWLKYHGGKIIDDESIGSVEFSEEDYIILRLKFSI